MRIGSALNYDLAVEVPSEMPSSTPDSSDEWQAAIDYGIDVSQLEYLLTLTPTERILRHQQALELVRAMRQAGREHYGFDPRDPQAAP